MEQLGGIRYGTAFEFAADLSPLLGFAPFVGFVAALVVVAPVYAGAPQRTGRKYSCAVVPMMERIRFGFFTPGICTMISLPWVVMFGWVTPSASARSIMMFAAFCNVAAETFWFGV